MEDFGSQTVIAHNEASPARDRVLQIYEERDTSINILIGLPSLDGIKRAVEMGLGGCVVAKTVCACGDSTWRPSCCEDTAVTPYAAGPLGFTDVRAKCHMRLRRFFRRPRRVSKSL